MDITIETVDGLEFAHVRKTGVWNYDAAVRIREAIVESLSLGFGGNIIYDLRDADDQLTDRDAERLSEDFSKTRYFYRRAFAVIRPESEIQRSRKHLQIHYEREGILVRDFTSMDAAIAWLTNPDE